MDTASVPLNTTFTAYKIPLSVILQWPQGNYVNPERRIWLAPYAVIWEVIGTLLLGARLYSRYTKTAGRFGLDDILVCTAWAFALIFTALSIQAVLEGGFDRHVWDNPPATAEKGGLLAWQTEFFFTVSTVLTKLSILVFHKRLMSRTSNKYMVWAIYAAMAFTVVYLVAFIFFLVFICSPTNASWKSLNINYNQPYKCAYRGIVDPMWGLVSTLSDIYAIVLPELLVKRLQISKKQKIMLGIVFGCGIMTVVTGAIRTVLLRKLSTDRLRDITWIGYDIIIFTITEAHLALICASAPALKGFFEVYVVAPLTKSQGGTTIFGTYQGDSAFKTAARKASNAGIMTSSKGKEDDEQGIVVLTRFSLSSEMGEGRRRSVESFDIAPFQYPDNK